MAYDPAQEFKQNRAARETAKSLYDSNTYQLEKVVGKRTATGALKLKRLKPEHRQIIALHLKGHSNRDISFLMDRDEVTISRVLHDPLSEQLIQQHLAGVDKELDALTGLAIDALRDGLQQDDIRIRLKAADQTFHAQGKYHHADKKDDSETAEDVISRALEAISNQAGAIKELSRPDRPRALDVEFTKIEEPEKNGNSSDSQQRENQQRLPLLEVGDADRD